MMIMSMMMMIKKVHVLTEKKREREYDDDDKKIRKKYTYGQKTEEVQGRACEIVFAPVDLFRVLCRFLYFSL